jgi:hypothetical protein
MSWHVLGFIVFLLLGVYAVLHRHHVVGLDLLLIGFKYLKRLCLLCYLAWRYKEIAMLVLKLFGALIGVGRGIC